MKRIFLTITILSVVMIAFQANSQRRSRSQRSSSATTKANKKKCVVIEGSQTFTVNGVTFTMVPVEGGTFTMGASPEQEKEAMEFEYPAHQVTMSSFFIGQTEVTQELWKAVMGKNPSWCNGSQKPTCRMDRAHRFGVNLKRPVECVGWYDCLEFIEKLNQLTGKNFRLPTEAEWEYAARGGNKSKGYIYSGSNNANEVSWNGINCGQGVKENSTHPVATKAPNELGIYDMSGNVWEWCQDWLGYYKEGAQTNPVGPEWSDEHALRGGSWNNLGTTCCRVSSRTSCDDTREAHIGFRLALSL